MNIYDKENRDIHFYVFSSDDPNSIGSWQILSSITSDDLTDEDIADGGTTHKSTIEIILKYYDIIAASGAFTYNRVIAGTAQ